MYSLLSNCIILAFYPYQSCVVDYIYSVTSQDRDGLKWRVCEEFGERFQKNYQCQQRDGSFRIQWDNKIVLKCQSSRGNIFYIGKYDGKWSIGLGVNDMDNHGSQDVLLIGKSTQ